MGDGDSILGGGCTRAEEALPEPEACGVPEDEARVLKLNDSNTRPECCVCSGGGGDGILGEGFARVVGVGIAERET